MYETRILSSMSDLIKAAAQAMGDVAEIEITQDSQGECKATICREPHQATARREDRADEAASR